MAYWLLKSEPGTWSWQDQCAVKSEPWDGVRNFQAQKNMRTMAVGDKAFFYHSGKSRDIVGVVDIVRSAYPDPSDASGRFCLVDVAADKSFGSPVTLARIKAEESLADMALVQQSRLSVSPVSEDDWRTICAMGGVEV